MTISDTLKAALFQQETDEVLLVLLTISHDDLVAPIRLVNNTENISSNGETFIGFPFKITMPLNDPNNPPRAAIEIDNVDRQIVDAIRSITSAPAVQLDIIRADAPDVLEVTLPDFVLQDAAYDVLTVTGTLSFENFLLEPYPADQFIPSTFPGIF